MLRKNFHSLLLLSLGTLLNAQVSPSLFNDLHWRLVGPFRGGRAVAVSGVPGGGSTFYFGSVDGGVWKTTDAGVVWQPLFDHQPVASIGALAVAPSDPNIIYAGSGESDIRSDTASGDGVYKSSDGGQSWQNVGLRDTRQISRILIDPRDPNSVMVAALGHAYGPNEERGVFRSTDGGATWSKVLYRGPQIGAADLAMAADNPQIVFAAMWEAQRPPWSTYAPIAGPGSGMYRSQDGGKTWNELKQNGLPDGPWGRLGLAVSANTHGERVYASIDAKQGGIYRSNDGGNHWQLVNSDARLTSRAWYFSCITVDPNNSNTLYVPNVALFKLSDGGKTLSIVRGAPGGDDYHQLWIDPTNSSHMLLGTDQGTTVTLNGGLTWSSWYNQPTAQFYHVITDNAFPYHLFGAQQDSGTAGTVNRTDHGEIDGRDWFTVSGSESGYIAPDPKDSNIFYVSGTYGSVVRFDRRMMQSQNVAPSLAANFGTEINERKYRDPWTPVLVFSPLQPEALYFGTQYVMRTMDGGLHWQTISPDLTGAEPATQKSKAGGPPSVQNTKQRGYGVVYTIAPSPVSASEIWAGSDTGLIHLTRDGGRSWANVTPLGLAAWSKITQIEASHSKAGEAYAAVDRHRLDDMRPYLFRTRDFGKSWQPVVDGFAPTAFLNAIREDPRHAGLLFAGTEFGIYVSFDDGDHWQSLQLNLPVTSVRDLAVHDDDLVAATHGRAFWILDDISALRQVDLKVQSSNAFLYKPARATRILNDAFPGTPLPPEEPQAQNPPEGAVIDYYLASTASGPVELDILDSAGKLVRHFSSRDQPVAPPENAAIAARWFKKPISLSEESGMHRFAWDLRYGRRGERTTEEDEETGMQVWIGPLVAPGAYRVKLTVPGKGSLEQKLDVRLDPRSHATPEILATQLRLAQQVFNDLVTARIAASEIHGLRLQLAKASAGLSANAALSKRVATLDKQVQTIQNGDAQTAAGLASLSRAFAVALNATQHSDRAPSAQVVEMYHESDQQLQRRVAEWGALKQNAVPPLSQELRSAGQAPIQIVRVQEEPTASLSQ